MEESPLQLEGSTVCSVQYIQKVWTISTYPCPVRDFKGVITPLGAPVFRTLALLKVYKFEERNTLSLCFPYPILLCSWPCLVSSSCRRYLNISTEARRALLHSGGRHISTEHTQARLQCLSETICHTCALPVLG
jgi:hypothetical protein